jgi:hypothetical protein
MQEENVDKAIQMTKVEEPKKMHFDVVTLVWRKGWYISVLMPTFC